MSQNGSHLLLISAKATTGFNIAPPLGLYQLASYVERHGVPVDVLDRELDDPDSAIAAAAEGKYAIIGFSVSHDRMAEELDLILRFRDAVDGSGRPAIFIGGGQEAALNHEQWLEAGLDVCFLGFGERPLLAFCRGAAAADGNGIDLDALCAGIDGVTWRQSDGALAFRPSTPLDQPSFDELFHERILALDIPYHRYWKMLSGASADTGLGASEFVIENVRLYTSSHCPRRCGFCNSQSFLPRSQGGKLPITMLSADRVADLILHMAQRYGARGFLFSDDDFPTGTKAGLSRLTELCSRIAALKREGAIDPDTRFACQARVMDFVRHDGQGRRIPDRDLMRVMVAAGFGSIGMGVETFSDRMLKAPSVNKVGVTAADCHMIIKAMLEVGLVPQINVILGIPEYTVDELAETIAAAVDYLRQGCDVAVTRKLLALPGAPIYGRDLYETRYRPWRNPRTGAEVVIADYYPPLDPAVRSAVERFDEAAAAELDSVVQARGWQDKIIHKRVVSITALLAAARLLGRVDLMAVCSAALEEVLAGKARPVA